MDIFNFIFTLLLIISLFIISFCLIKINKKQQETEELLEKSIKKLEQDLANEKFKKRMLIYKNKLINKENSEEYDNIYFNFKRKGIAPEQFYKNRLNNKSLAKHHMLPKIKLLLDKGYNLPEIAKMLDISNGELKIIMDFGIE